jgi:hypothetical protein
MQKFRAQRFLVQQGRRFLVQQGPYFILALLVAGVWLLFSKDLYSYNRHFMVIKGVNLFPLIIWLLGLFLFYFLYIFLEDKFWDRFNPSRTFWRRFFLYTLLYWVFLLTVESFGYHVLNIHNLGTSQYPGLPICDCIHAPVWMQVSYFMMGPIYFMLCELWRNLKKLF